MSDECNRGRKIIYRAFTCFFIVSLDKIVNGTISFSKFSMSGSKQDCSQAKEHLEVRADHINSLEYFR